MKVRAFNFLNQIIKEIIQDRSAKYSITNEDFGPFHVRSIGYWTKVLIF